ncbi:MAG: DegT/DnrJ/EryC1/StrS family aminotransferase [Candidatus Hydrogenedentota bacterium]
MSRQESNETTRRGFMQTVGALGAGAYLAAGSAPTAAAARKAETLALNGGPMAVTADPANPTKWPLYGDAEIEAVSALLRDPGYGPIEVFENAWKEYFGCDYAKAHCNGTSALTSMLFALELPPGSEVLVASYSTWFPVVPMRFFGLVPVFVDSDPKTLNISIEDCKRRLTKNTRAIMPVHWYGVPCEMDAIEEFAKEHGLEVIEDASHAHGAKVQGKLIGNWGRMAGFSMQATKPLPSIEGGIAMYKDRFDYERATVYGNYDFPNKLPEDSPYRKYHGTAFGSKLRIHPVSAILARLQLEKMDEMNTAGAAQIRKLNDRITQLPGLTEQYARPDMDRVYYSKNLMFIDEKKAGMPRSKAVEALRAEGVDVHEYRWTLLHTYPIFQEERWWSHMPVLCDDESIPGANEANRTCISLPYWTSDQPEIVEQYAKAFEKVWAHRDSIG